MQKFLDHNVTGATGIVENVVFDTIHSKKTGQDYDVCRVFVTLDEFPDYEWVEKIFFLNSKDSKDYFLATLKNALEWWGDIENLEKPREEGGVIGTPCKVTTQAREYNGKTYVSIQYLNHINDERVGKPEIDPEEKRRIITELQQDMTAFEKSTQTLEDTQPHSTTKTITDDITEDDVPF